MIGVEGAGNAGRGILQLGCFWALGTRVVASPISFVADVLELTIGALAGAVVVVATDGCHCGLLDTSVRG